MRRPRLLFGCLQPGSTVPFLLLPDQDDDADAGGGGTKGDGTGGSDTKPDTGYPADTPLEQMTVEQQAAYWKSYARRNRDALKRYKAETAPKLSEFDRLVEASKDDNERAVDAAKASTRAEMAPRLVAAELRAASGGRLSAEEASFLNPTVFLDAVGDVDDEKVAAYVAKRFAPGTEKNDGPKGDEDKNGAKKTWPDTGGGNRGGSGTGTATVQSGRELYARLKNTPAPTP